MRDPVHWIKPQDPRAIPCAPGDRTRFDPSHRGLHQRPAAQDDEHPDGVETESRHMKPRESQDSQRARGEIAPVSWRKNAVFEIRSEKVKVSDEENCQPL